MIRQDRIYRALAALVDEYADHKLGLPIEEAALVIHHHEALLNALTRISHSNGVTDVEDCRALARETLSAWDEVRGKKKPR